jgi:hypothetical protein
VACLITAVVGVAAAHGQPTRLQYKWVKGDETRYRLVQTTNSKVSGIPDQPEAAIDQVVTQVIKQTVESVAADGTVILRQTFESADMDMKAPGVPGFDGPQGAGASQMATANATMKALVGETILVSISATGLVTKVEGMSRILDKMAATMPAGTEQQQTRAALTAMMGDEQMRKTMERNFAVFPDRPLSPGESWSRDMEVTLPMVGTLTATTTSTFKGVEPINGSPMARVALDTIMKPRADATPPPAGPVSGTIVDNRTQGEVLFDVTLGRVQKVATTTDMTMKVAVPGPAGEAVNFQTLVHGTVTMEVIQ